MGGAAMSLSYNADLAQFVSDYMSTCEQASHQVSDVAIGEAYIESCLEGEATDEQMEAELERLLPQIAYLR